MAWILIRHKVQDYAKFKAAFDEHGAGRKANGSKGGYVFRNIDDPAFDPGLKITYCYL